MTETPKVPDAPETPKVDDIVEVIFEDHYALAVMAFIAGALIVAGIVYWIGSRTVEGESDAEN